MYFEALMDSYDRGEGGGVRDVVMHLSCLDRPRAVWARVAVSLRAPCDAVEAFLLTFFFLKKRLPLFLVLFPMNFSSSESAAEAALPPSPPWLPWLFRSPAAATGRPVALLHDGSRRNGDSNSGVNSSHESRGPSEEGRRKMPRSNRQDDSHRASAREESVRE